MEDIESKASEERKLKYESHLGPFRKYLKPTCIDLKPGDVLVVYRTFDIVPVDDYGQTPRALRPPVKEAVNRELTDEEVDTLSDNQRSRYMGEWGLSCNATEKDAIDSWLFTYNKLKRKGADVADLDAYCHERGKTLCRFNITTEIGMLTQFDEHGHSNLYLYEGVNLEDCRDKEYNYNILNYEEDDNK